MQASPTTRTKRLSLLAAGFLLSLPCMAQRQVSIDDLNGLSQTDRETIHPGDPLIVVGIDQEDNAFREASPALTKGELAVTTVDVDELRQRRLAMYSERAKFSTPPASSQRMSTVVENRALAPFAADRPEVPIEEPEEDEGSSLPYWIGGIVIAGAFIAMRRN